MNTVPDAYGSTEGLVDLTATDVESNTVLRRRQLVVPPARDGLNIRREKSV